MEPQVLADYVNQPALSGPSASASAKTRKVPKRLSQEGYRLIHEFRAINPDPSITERKELLKRIHALPDCEHYTLNRLTTVLKQKRDRIHGPPKTPKEQEQLTVDDILYPSFKGQPKITGWLRILLAETKNPSEELIRVWASKLKVKHDDISAWISVERVKNTVKQEPVSEDSSLAITAVPQLPTPATSCSPEPDSGLKSPAVESEEARPPASSSMPKHETRATAADTPIWRELTQALDKALAEPVKAPDFSNASIQEMNDLLTEHENRITAFLGSIESGDYARWGLDSSLLTPAKEHPMTLYSNIIPAQMS
ncbi:hypothetical protein WOLCODRAFT_125701 [Wolfiporia cocos MD-104 SS10]|uniref:Homeobox domain-containing protein n=1 Tax=Wolfiporia cocos (strain MD-104) TaxID=742152 RepID=A0A2H3J951_WOLCO|nr:hypothetical protein WOLCODRAFT_125701 [Wolfiporia cocos MD-104 SS10]